MSPFKTESLGEVVTFCVSVFIELRVKMLRYGLKSGTELHTGYQSCRVLKTSNKLRSRALPGASREVNTGIGLSIAERFGSIARPVIAELTSTMRLVRLSIGSVWVCLKFWGWDGKWLSSKVGFTYLHSLRHFCR